MDNNELTLYKQAKKKTPIYNFVLSMPFIYGMIFPSILLDITVEIYHNVAFRLYGIPLLKRSDYIIIDRHLLSKLTFMQKINCIYCGYVNGLYRYAADIAGETEKYWCPIKHGKDGYIEKQPHHKEFYDRKDFE